MVLSRKKKKSNEQKKLSLFGNNVWNKIEQILQTLPTTSISNALAFVLLPLKSVTTTK